MGSKQRQPSYYDLYPLSKTPGWPEDQWYEEGKRSWLCSGCVQPLSTSGPIDAYLAYPPDNAAINFISGVGIGYAQTALLEIIGAEATLRPLSLGNLYDAQGRRLEDYATFRAEEMLFIRGRQLEGLYGAKFRVCPVCGRLLYFPMGARYIVASELTGDSVYENQLRSLLVDEDAYRRLKQQKWRKLGIWKLPVEDVEPADRLSLHRV